MNEIIKNIEAIRKQKGIKQAVLAELLGVKQSAYSQYITRSNDIPYSRLLQISEKLGISVIDIITFPDHYVLESNCCDNCKEKDIIIKNLNDYINILKEIKK